MSDAIRIERRFSDLFAGRRRRRGSRQAEQETPREIEARAMEHLYGHRSNIVVRSQDDDGDAA